MATVTAARCPEQPRSGIEECCNTASRMGVGTDCLRPTSSLRRCRCRAARAALACLAAPRRGRTPQTSHANCPAGTAHHTTRLIQLQHQPHAHATLCSAILLVHAYKYMPRQDKKITSFQPAWLIRCPCLNHKQCDAMLCQLRRSCSASGDGGRPVFCEGGKHRYFRVKYFNLPTAGQETATNCSPLTGDIRSDRARLSTVVPLDI